MKRLRALGLSIAIGTIAIGCHGRAKSASDWSSKKTPYQHGTVLHHAPDCAGGHLFLDLAAAEKNVATRAAVEVLSSRMLGGIAASPSERRAFNAIGDALRDEKLDPGRDTKELALCSLGAEGGLVAVFGGDYSGKDVFRAIGAAAERVGDKPPPIEERQGIEYVRLGKLVIARVSANAVAIGEDVALLVSLGRDADRSAAYGYAPGLVAVAQIGTGGDAIGLRFAGAGEDVLVEVTMVVKDSVEVLERRRSGVATRLDETPLRGLSPLATNAKISVAGGHARFEMRGRAADVANAIQTAAELPPNELKRIIGYVFGGADGTGGPEQKI
jgi:hypothetical protein